MAVALGTLLYVLTRRQTTVATRPEIKSLAVLPLQNLSGDPTQEYFADGMTEALISSLAQIRALRVISRTSVMSFKETKKPLPPLPEIARELKVDGVIEGSLQRENGRLKMMIQLIHGPTDTHLWARDYQHELTDLLKLQGEMARAIADEIRVQVTPEERARLAFARSIDPAAHEAYLLGRYHAWKHNGEELEAGYWPLRAHYPNRTETRDRVCRSLACLAVPQLVRGHILKESQSPARAAAQRALELDARHAAAHSAVGHAKYLYDWDWTGAEKDLRRALDLEPNNADAHFYYSKLLQTLGRLPEAIYEIERARQLDPLSSVVESMFGQTLYSARRYDEAIPHLKRSIELEPRNFLACRRLANVYAQMGRYDDALACLEKLPERGKKRTPAFDSARVRKDGEADQSATKIYGTVEGFSLSGFLPADAGAYAALGENDEAFRLLMKKIENATLPGLFVKDGSGVRQPPFRSTLAGAAPPHEFAGGVVSVRDALVSGSHYKKLRWSWAGG